MGREGIVVRLPPVEIRDQRRARAVGKQRNIAELEAAPCTVSCAPEICIFIIK
jgi:hypothetical protein